MNTALLPGVYLCIMIQLLLLAIASLLKKNRRNKILGLFSLLIVMTTGIYAFWDYIEGSFLYPVLGGPVHLFLGPVLYVYLVHLKFNTASTGSFYHLYFAAGIYSIAHPMQLYFFNVSSFDIFPFYLLLAIGFNTVYFIKSIRLFRKDLSLALKHYPKMRFTLFYIISLGYILIKILVFTFFVSKRFFTPDMVVEMNQVYFLPFNNFVLKPLYVIFPLFLIGYSLTEISGLRKYFLTVSIHEEKITIPAALEKEIEDSIISGKIYLNPDFNLKTFLDTCPFHPETVKQYFANSDYRSFSNFINFLRLQEFKSNIRSENYSKYDFYSIARESGFRSKSSFYRIFKSFEGITPGEYRELVPDQH